MMPGPFPGCRQRRTPVGLHGVEPDAGAESGADAGSERSAADLHEDSIELDTAGASGLGHLPTDRSAAIEAVGILGTLHAERDRTTGDGFAEAEQRRIAVGVVGAPLAARGRWRRARRAAHRTRRPSRSARTRRSASSTGLRASLRRALRCRTTRSPAAGVRSSRPSDSAARRCKQDRHEVASLVRTGDVAGLVLHPHVDTEFARQVVGAAERRDLEVTRHVEGERDT